MLCLSLSTEGFPLDTFRDILRDARRLRKTSMRLLKGVVDGSVKLKPGVTKDEAIAILQEDIAGSRKLIRRLGGKDA